MNLRNSSKIISILVIFFTFISVINFLLLLFSMQFIESEKGHRSSEYKEHFGIRKIIKNKLHKNSDVKTVVIWSSYYGKGASWKRIFKRHHLNECEEQRCHITTTKKKLESADAVIFNGAKLMTLNDTDSREFFPPVRSWDQIYIFFSQDPPTMAFENVNYEKYKNFFNWTMTFRTDSDVVVPYGKVSRRKERKHPNDIHYLSEESLITKQLAIWLESHCDTQSQRRKFVEALQRYIPIDVYGRCIGKECGSRSLIFKKDVGEDLCEKSFNRYVFFLALENSFCKDYVTEKLYRSLKLDIIPVVFGAVNYTEFAPPNSFIDAKEFKSIGHLADFMRKVARNVSLYNSFLRWKEHYDIDIGFPYKTHICDLCKKLHSPNELREPKTYSCIKDWFNNEGHCYKFNKFDYH